MTQELIWGLRSFPRAHTYSQEGWLGFLSAQKTSKSHQYWECLLCFSALARVTNLNFPPVKYKILTEMKETQKKKIFLPLLQTAVILSRALVCQAQQRSGRERLRFHFPGLVFPISRYNKWLSGCKEKAM